jgi:UDP-N-acetyl-D-glucosamine dehydrogenase
MLPILSESGLQVGSDFYLAFAPERIDPGNQTFGVRNTPKLVGGVTPACTEVAAQFYAHFIDVVERVDSPEVAELAKLVENTFRFINISFANELALLCDRMDVSVWEVIRAASTKPFAFMPHYPGPGVGGHCIPVVPFYLQAAAEELGLAASLIESAGRVNDAMPAFVVDKAERLLAQRGTDPSSAKYLLLGVTYKPDVRDLRESPALAVLRTLQDRGRDVRFHDPLVNRVLVEGQAVNSVALTADELQRADCVLLLTGHASLDHDLLLANARLLLDTRNILAGRDGDNLVIL